MGIVYPPNALFVAAFGFVLLVLLNFSIAVSRLSEQTSRLAQRLAMLEEQVRRSARPSSATDAQSSRNPSVEYCRAKCTRTSESATDTPRASQTRRPAAASIVSATSAAHATATPTK